jgi:hypothetical protein
MHDTQVPSISASVAAALTAARVDEDGRLSLRASTQSRPSEATQRGLATLIRCASVVALPRDTSSGADVTVVSDRSQGGLPRPGSSGGSLHHDAAKALIQRIVPEILRCKAPLVAPKTDTVCFVASRSSMVSSEGRVSDFDHGCPWSDAVFEQHWIARLLGTAARVAASAEAPPPSPPSRSGRADAEPDPSQHPFSGLLNGCLAVINGGEAGHSAEDRIPGHSVGGEAWLSAEDCIPGHSVGAVACVRLLFEIGTAVRDLGSSASARRSLLREAQLQAMITGARRARHQCK